MRKNNITDRAFGRGSGQVKPVINPYDSGQVKPVINPYDYVGFFIDKKCPKCGAKMLKNKIGDEWCSSCNYGREDCYKILGL